MSEEPRLLAGRYELRHPLGSGGAAVVWYAFDRDLGVPRAVKVLTVPSDLRAALRQRLRQEARIMARLEHPNVLRVLDVAEADGQDFVVMELAPGGSLHALLERAGPLAARVALGYVVQVLSALEAAHANGVIHRDVKPHNVLLDKDGAARLADFGIARVFDADHATRAGVAMGSFAYMPPEQRLDARSVGPGADLYAAGATLYALLTQRNPIDLFTADEGSERFAGIEPDVRAIIVRATRAAPSDRYRSAAEMAADCEAALRARSGEPDAALPAGALPELDITTLAVGATPPEPLPHAVTVASALPAPPRAQTAPRRRTGVLVALALAAALVAVGVVSQLAPAPMEAGSLEEPTSAAPAAAPREEPSSAAEGPTASEPASPAPEPASPEPRSADRGSAEPPAEPSAASVPAAEAAPLSAPTGPPPLGRWTGAFGGRPAELVLGGDPSAPNGTFTVRFGSNQVATPLTGTWDDPSLVLEDSLDAPDAGTYRGVVARGVYEGTFEARSGRVVAFRLTHGP